MRNTGTPAFCNRAAATNPAFDSGPNTYAHFGDGGSGVCAGFKSVTLTTEASNGFAIARTSTPSM